MVADLATARAIAEVDAACCARCCPARSVPSFFMPPPSRAGAVVSAASAPSQPRPRVMLALQRLHALVFGLAW